MKEKLEQYKEEIEIKLKKYNDDKNNIMIRYKFIS